MIDIPTKKTLMSHQKVMFQKYASRVKFGNWSEMGTGKTIPTAKAIEGSLRDRIVDCFVIILPNNLLRDWLFVLQEEIECKHKICIFHGPNRVWAGEKIILTTYQVFVNEFDLFVTILRSRAVGVVIDEASQIRNAEGKVARRVAKYAQLCKVAYLMSGNPAPNGYMNWFIPLYILMPQIYPDYKAFKALHVGRDRYQWRNVPLLEANIASCSVRFMKEQCLDLPKQTFQVIELDMSDKQAELYEKIVDDCFLELTDGRVIEMFDVLSMMTRCRQIATNPSLLGFHDIKCPKFAQLEEDLDQLLPKTKVIIWCEFIDSGYKIMEIAKKAGRKCAQLFDTKAVKIEDEKRKFQTDPECTVLVVNPKSGARGLNLQVAWYDILFEYDFDLDLYDQLLSRTHRQGQEHPVLHRHYCMRGTIEAKILHALRKKKQLVHKTLKDPEEFRHFLHYKPTEAWEDIDDA